MLKHLLCIVFALLISCSPTTESTNQEEYPVFEEEMPNNIAVPESGTNTSLRVKNTAHFHTVEIKQMKFNPPVLKILKGDTVMWINKDFVLHDVTEEDEKLWSSSPIAIGGSWSKVINESVDYYCSLHLIMKGALLVE